MDERLVGPAHHVDEAGGYSQSLGVDFSMGAPRDVADGGDGIVADGQVAGVRRAAITVIDHSITDEDVMHEIWLLFAQASGSFSGVRQ